MTMLPLPPRLARVQESQITALLDTARDRADVIKLWVGEPDIPTPAFIRDAAIAALNAGETRYTYALGLPALREELALYHARHWGVSIAADRFCPTVGGMNAIMQALQVMTEPCDEVIYPSPAWPNLAEAVRLVSAVPVPVSFDFDRVGGFSLDLQRLFAAVTSKTRVIAINSPSNPTGWRMPLDQMIALRDFARERGIWILSDEVYAHFCFDKSVAPSFLQICEPQDRLIVANTFSKNWAMTGFRVGWVVFPQGFASHFDNLSQFNTTGVATFIQHAAIAALAQGDAGVAALRERSMATGRLLVEGLSAILDQEVLMPRGSFYLMADTRRFGDGKNVAYRLLRDANVGVAPGVAFGEESRNFVRICFAVSQDIMIEGLQRIAKCLVPDADPLKELVDD